MKFKNYIEAQSGIKDSADSPGTSSQVLTSTATGVAWIDQATIVSGSAERVSILVKNGEGAALVKGDPVYIIGSVGASARLEVGLCDASDPDKMPCVGLLEQDLLNNGQGTAVTAGKLRNLVTTPIDGQATSENDTIYVKAGGSSGSSLTTIKPTGSTNLIQNVGQVGRVSSSSDGNFVVSAIMRTNDVPNLPEGRIWVGDGNTIVSDTVYVDEPNNRVGIGTVSPDAKLDVKNSTVSSYSLRFTASDDGDMGGWYQDASNNSELFLKDGGSSTKVIINSSGDSYFNGGNVGIGTANPLGKLTVSANGAEGIEFFPNNFTNGNTIQHYDRTGLAYSSVKTIAGDHRFNIGTSEAMRIASNGNVGIGTTSPGAKLHVEGNVLIDAYNQGEDNGLFFREGFLTIDQPSITVWDMTNGGSSPDGLSINSNDGIRFRENGGEVARFKDGNFGIGTTGPSAKLEVNDSANDLQMRVGSLTAGISPSFRLQGKNTANTTNYYADIELDAENGKLIFNDPGTSGGSIGQSPMVIDSSGNVGIGTTSPSEKLEVTGNVVLDSTNARLKIKGGAVGTNSGIDWTFNTDSTVYAKIQLDYDTRASTGLLIDSGYPMTLDYSSGSFSVKKNGSSELTILNGNVGIGTTSPDFKLDLGNSTSSNNMFRLNGDFSDVLFSGNVTAPTGGVGLWNFINTGTNPTTRLYVQDANNSDSRLTFDFKGNGGSVDILSGTSSGNVGIGTTSPSYKLEVNAGNGIFVGDGGAPVLEANSSTGLFKIGDTDELGDGVYLTNDTGGNLDMYSGGSIKVRMNFNGNVGIGTTNPTTNYSKVLQINASGNGSTLRLTDAGSGSAVSNGLELLQYGVDSYIINRENGVMRFWNNNSSKMVILANGNVGIGTTSPSYKLQLSTNSAAKPSSSTWTVVSDERVKENIKPYEKGLNEILQVNTKTFDYNGKAGFDKIKDNVGIIAQDMIKIFPETIKTYKAKLNETDEEETELYNFDGHALTFALINAIQELKAEIELLKNK